MDEQLIFVEALERESEVERVAFLNEACPDTKLRARVERLLRLHQDAGDFLDVPAVDRIDAPFDAPLPFEEAGQTIGPYKLLEQIGEGGMGVVYMAAQQSPVKRKVAMKIIKPGMDTKQVVARFEAERQALAMMEHPNIARVLDAGATELGRPYFVMELVRGIPITEYCQHERLDHEQRLKLFIDVCHAVQHAHQKGIIHRDIKPSNVMVTLHDSEPVVKIIDFGVAKATNQQLTDRTLFTNYAQMIGTPLYMSPEQAEMSGLDVDTRSDIYSLGVLLFELLTDTTPFEQERLIEVGYDEMRRIICEEEPPRPSTRLSTLCGAVETISDKRRADARRMSQTLRGELDWIAIKALDKNRGRRYQSVKEFADDVKRYLNGEPVQACPPSVAYRLKKLLAKYRGIAATAATITLLLIVATAVSTTFAIRAMQAEKVAENAQENAETEAAIAKAISDFLGKELLGQASPFENPNRDLKLREVLDRTSERIEGHFDGPPLLEAAIRMALGTTYRHLGEYEAAAKHLKRAYELRTESLGEEHPDTLKSAFERGVAELYCTGSKRGAELLNRTLERQRAVLGDEQHDTLVTMGWLAYCYALQRRFDEAEPLFEKANAGFKRVLGPDHPDTLDCLDGMARMFSYQERYEEAEVLQTQLLEKRRRILGEMHPQFQDSLSALADTMVAQGNTDKALPLYKRAVSLRQQVQGASHPATLSDARDMGSALQRVYQFEAAEAAYLETLHAEQQRYGNDDERTLWTMRRLASLYSTQGHSAKAARLYEAVLESRRRILGNDHEFTINAMKRLADVCLFERRFADAQDLHAEMVETQSRLYGPHDKRTIDALLAQAHGFQEGGRHEDAERIGKELLEWHTLGLGRKSAKTLKFVMRMGFTYKKSGKLAESEEMFREAWETARSVREIGPEHRETLRAGNQLAVVMKLQGRLREAEALSRDVLEARVRVCGEEDVDTTYSLVDLGLIYEDLERFDEAIECHTRAIRIRRKINGDDHPQTMGCVQWLARLAKGCEQRGQWTSAISARQRVYEVECEILGETHPTAMDSLVRLARCYEMAEDWQKLCETRERELALRRDPKVQDNPPFYCMHVTALAMVKVNRLDDAVKLLRECVRQWEESDPKNRRKYFSICLLGELLTKSGDYKEAESMLMRSHNAWSPDVSKDHPVYRQLLERLVALYEASGEKDSANRWAEELKSIGRIP